MIRPAFMALAALGLLIMAVALTGCATPQRSTEYAWQGLHLVDAIQTNQIVGNPNYQEGHPLTRMLIGREPSHQSVALWAVGGALGHLWVSSKLANHPRLFYAWEAITIADTGASVGHNWSLGIKVKF